MGEKDFQQLYLVKNFIEKKYKTKIIRCKTIRNKNKLALSSRNLLLHKDDLKIAGSITKRFIIVKKKIKKHRNIKKFLLETKKDMQNMYKIKIEYLELRNKKSLVISKKLNESKLFVAYYLKGTRLIDNF